MISLRTEMKNLRIILALACGFAAFQLAAAQAKAPGRAPGTVFRDCQECPEMVVVPADSFTIFVAYAVLHFDKTCTPVVHILSAMV
jgi:hypothetical protein